MIPESVYYQDIQRGYGYADYADLTQIFTEWDSYAD